MVPAGTYLTGSLFFKQGVNLYVAEGGTLKGEKAMISRITESARPVLRVRPAAISPR